MLNHFDNNLISSGFLYNPDNSSKVSLTPTRTTGNTRVFNFIPFTTTEEFLENQLT